MPEISNIDRVLHAAADRGDVPGVVAVAGSDQGQFYEGAFGKRDWSKPDAMTPDTVFWVASMTKAIVSAAAMQMVEQDKVGLDEDLSGLLPGLAQPQVLEGWDDNGEPKLRPARNPVILRHLLTHTAGFSYEMWNADIVRYQQYAGLPSIISCENRALETPLVADPGTRWEYGINIDFAGKLVERLSGQPLDAYLQEHIFAPLGMSETGFKIRPDQRPRLARMHARGEDGSLTPIDFELRRTPSSTWAAAGFTPPGATISRFAG
jgi:methyl acetate hydrolase